MFLYAARSLTSVVSRKHLKESLKFNVRHLKELADKDSRNRLILRIMKEFTLGELKPWMES